MSEKERARLPPHEISKIQKKRTMREAGCGFQSVLDLPRQIYSLLQAYQDSQGCALGGTPRMRRKLGRYRTTGMATLKAEATFL